MSGLDAAPTGREAESAPASRFSLQLPLVLAIETALGAVGLATFVVWAWRDGGFAPEEWLPGGLLLLALLCTAVTSADVRARLRARRLPLILFGLYVVWSYLSVIWAQVSGDALDGANRTLVYWVVVALFTGLGVSERLGAWLVLAWGTAVAGLGLVALAEAGTAATPAGHFVQGRLAAPLSYPDGDAALFLSACLPLLVLASRPRAHVPARLATCAVGVVLADLAVLCQSRGSLVALSCGLVLYLAVARNRLRALVQIGIAAASVAPAVPTLLHVYSAVIASHGRADAVVHAAEWMAGSAGLAIACSGVVLLVERNLTFSARSLALIGRGVAALAAAAVVGAVAVSATNHPVGRIEGAWHDFTTNKTAEPSTLHFAAGVGTSRSDVWRIAWDQFVAHPVTGVGADNFVVGYLRDRRTTEMSRYPESTVLRTLSETGIVGAGLFLGFLATVFWQAARAARRSRSPGLPLACLVSCGYWLFHSSIDWFWELPALTGAALALLAIASAPTLIKASQPAQRRRSLTLKVTAAGTALAAAAVLAIQWASVSLIDAAVARGASHSGYSMLATAGTLNPLSEEPAIVEATLAANAGDRARERRALLKARQKNPFDWYPYFMLGIVAGREHHLVLARAELAAAHRRSPRNLVIVYAQKRLRWGEPLTERQVGQIFREVTSTLRGVRQQ